MRDKSILNTQRILILTALYLSDRLMFIELSRITGIDKGSLEYHLKILEENGLVDRKTYITLTGPRIYLEITGKGRELMKKIIRYFNQLSSCIS